METFASKTVLIRVESLARYYASLGRTLAQTGVSGNQLNDILSSCLEARCVNCEIPISGVEIEQISLIEDTTHLSHPKLKRLRLGYCAREGCESYEYAIHLSTSPGVDWDEIAAKTNDLMSAEKIAAKEVDRRRIRKARNQHRMRIGGGLFILIVLFALFFFFRNGRLPFVKKTHKYEVDPASIWTPPPR